MLAANLREDRPEIMQQSGFGLMGLPDSMREVAMEAMNRQIDDPHFPVSGWFLIVMPVVEEGSEASKDTMDEEHRRRREEAWQRVLAGLPHKEGKARAETARTLLGSQPEHLSAEAKASLGAVLADSFLELTEEEQTMQLQWGWDSLRSEAMLPKLQLLAKLPLSNPGSNLTSTYSRRELKAAAFRRWYEFDREGATREIVAEIGSGTPSLTAQSLSFLPAQTLPQYEGVWAQRLVESKDNQEEGVLAGLMVRFGTGTATSQVAGTLNEKGPCYPTAAALAYLVKFDQEAARPLLQRAVGARGEGDSRCNSTLFQNVSAYASGSVLTDAAVGVLDDTDSQTVMDALIYLADHGRKEDEGPIRERYLRWSETWAGKAEVLDSQERETQQANYQVIGVGEDLGRALIANQGWVADEQTIATVMKGCVGEQMCQQLKQIADMAAVPHHVTLYRNGETENYQVGQYNAKSMALLGEKIGQYPKGTVFDLIPYYPRNADQMALEKEAMALFEQKGMKLVPAAQ